MRQLNSKHFDTIEGASAHQGEIVSSQFAPSVSKKDENQMNYKQAKKEGLGVEYVFDIATNDKGMTARDTIRFHLYNPNGNYLLCRDWGFEAAKKGHFVLGNFAGRYENEELSKLLKMKKPRWRPIRVLIKMLYDEAIDWAERVKDVENRTDEEKEYFKNFLKGGK